MILTKIRYGTTAPNNAVGADGDLFINTSSGDWYVRSSGVYQLIDFANATNQSNIGTDLYLFFNY